MQVQPGSWLPWTVLSTSCGVPGQPGWPEPAHHRSYLSHSWGAKRLGATLTVADFIMPATLDFLNKMIYAARQSHIHNRHSVELRAHSVFHTMQAIHTVIVWFGSVSDPHTHMFTLPPVKVGQWKTVGKKLWHDQSCLSVVMEKQVL